MMPPPKSQRPTRPQPPADAAAKQKPLSITITELKSATAPVIFSVYQNPDTYLDPKAQLKTYRFVPKGKTLKIKLSDLKFGTYAIAFYQDMNDSGEIDKNGLGIPKEPYAFSNDIRPKMSAPSLCRLQIHLLQDRQLHQGQNGQIDRPAHAPRPTLLGGAVGYPTVFPVPQCGALGISCGSHRCRRSVLNGNGGVCAYGCSAYCQYARP
jgi:uncharacterized protein (DUF2141 family)